MKEYIKTIIAIIIILWAILRIGAIRWIVDEILTGKITLTLWIILWVLSIIYLILKEDKKIVDKF